MDTVDDMNLQIIAMEIAGMHQGTRCNKPKKDIHQCCYAALMISVASLVATFVVANGRQYERGW